MTMISCNALSLGYDGSCVVEGLNFSVERGQYLCIVGENGSGKSTLMRTLLGLQKPLGGSIVFGDGLLQTEIGYLPQQTPVQKDFPASVREVVRSGCLNRTGLRPFYSKADKQLAEDNMERMGLTKLKNRCYRELSGGQQQRVLLARALCATKSLLLLDEPVAGLDPVVTEEMYRLIEDLNRDGVTVIMVTHDIAAAIRYATHILHVSKTPQFFGTKEDYLKTNTGRAFAALAEGGETL